MDSIFEFKDITYRYKQDREPVIDHINFQIPVHKKTAIIGPNGAGKSTLLFHMNGLFASQQGEVWFKGKPVTAHIRSELVRHVGVVFQDPDDQLISITVRDDIAFGPIQFGLSAVDAYRIADDTMKLLHIAHLADRNPAELSFGQKKQVTLAGIIAMDTEVVILDEPMAFLDPMSQVRVQRIMDLLVSQGKTVIIATHHMHLVAEWAEHVIVIKDGTCVASMAPRQLFGENPNLLLEAQLDLPPVAQLFSGLWEGEAANIPIRMEEARAWLTSKIFS